MGFGVARKLRLQYPGALYHVINRGNYRSDIFASEGAKEAFLKCLGEACAMAGWKVHAYVIMRNHYHLALETPKANLIEGMQWLQSTYANRFNRLRREHGHVFQGRYHAIVIEDGARLGAVGHYIHLNPMRARIVTVQNAAAYKWSSLYPMMKQKERPTWMCVKDVLQSAEDLPDTPPGHKAYLDYLSWLDGDEKARKAFGFDRMCEGWAMGSQAFKVALIEDQKAALAVHDLAESDLAEIREQVWSKALNVCLKRLGKSTDETTREAKSSDWKVAIAAHLRRNSTVKNPWLARRLHMGDPDGVSRYVSELRQGKRPKAAKLLARITDIRV